MWEKLKPICLALVFVMVFSSVTAYAQDNAGLPKEPKYIFLFLGDGMSLSVIKAAEYYNGWKASGRIEKQPFNFSTFPAFGMVDTYSNSSFITGSDGAGTAIATGYKANDRHIGVLPDGSMPPSIAKILQEEKGMQVGLVTSVTINDASTASFYAHVENRSLMHEIAMQIGDSGFNFISGAIALATPDEWVNNGLPSGRGPAEDAYDYAISQGYTVINTREGIDALTAEDDKVIVSVADEYLVHLNWDEAGHQYYIDKGANDYTLADAVRKGIEVMSDSENGFFMVAELGRLDWALHANDGITAMKEIQGMHDAVAEALAVYEQYPDETLIIVTGDHETGGFSIGYAETEYMMYFDIADYQTISHENFYILFDDFVKAAEARGEQPAFENILPAVTQYFGLKFEGDPADDVMVVKPEELMELREAFDLNITPKADRDTRAYGFRATYGSNSYEPFTIAVLRLMNNRVGIGFTTFQHTAVPVPIYALGTGAEKFAGNIDNTDIYWLIREVSNLSTRDQAPAQLAPQGPASAPDWPVWPARPPLPRE